ncbi:MAG: two-component system response regulator [Gammaproteobacteria bacterium]|nr:MAG: two-component system response regulator [Gammaproteobacteria bacterium]
MSLTNVQQKILQPFIDECLENLIEMAEMEGYTEDGFVDTLHSFNFHGYAICAETTGALDGVIVMHHYIETALALGNAVRKNVLEEDLEYDEVNELMADALAEWGNTVVGRAVGSFEADNLGIKFEPPYFVYSFDIMSSLLTGAEDIITVPVHVKEIGRFYFNLLIRNVSPELEAHLNKEGTGEAKPATERAASVVFDKNITFLETNKKILVIDDMKTVRNSMVNYLSKLGYNNVVLAEDGKKAVEVFNEEQPDLLFMDVVMPVMNGNDVLKLIRKKNQQVPVVMLSSVAERGMVKECTDLGISGYVIKPLTAANGPDTLKQFLCP